MTRLESTKATAMAKVLENAIRERPTHANLMYPGIGVGGYCLTKDPLLASWSPYGLEGTVHLRQH